MQHAHPLDERSAHAVGAILSPDMIVVRPARPTPVAMAAIAVFAVMALSVTLLIPFPTSIDELQHYSVIREQSEKPALFADASRYRVIRQDDLSVWSTTRNYINHPSAYYLAMAPIVSVTNSILVLRLLNVALALAALLLVVIAGIRLFRSALGRAVFAILAASYPKGALVAGMVNNDNLAACAGAAVFAGLTGMAGGAWWMAAGLALAGWTKLTALVALGTVVGCDRLVRFAGDRARVWSADTLILIAGATVGAVPYLVNLHRTGRLLWFNADHFRVPPEQRIELGPVQFVQNFLATLVDKWPASENILPFGLALIGIATPLLLAALGMGRDRIVARLALPYAIALLVTLGIQMAFGWSAYLSIGDLTIAQTRYYNVLWPGLALAGAAATVHLARIWSRAAVPIVLIYLMPTLLGSMIVVALRST